MHDADDVVPCGGFGLQDVAVAEEDDSVGMNLDDSVDDMVASCVSHQCHCSLADVFVFPRAESHLVAQMHDERIHAVAFERYGHGLAFGNQRSDLLHHYCFVYGYGLGHIAKIQIIFPIFERYMENMHKYVVAGHAFAVTLPDGYTKEEHLAPYEPFLCTDDTVQPLFALRVEFVDDLHDVDPGQLKEVMNDEAPYFWLFESGAGVYNSGFSYSKSHPDCILKPSADYSDNVVYIPHRYASRLLEFSLSNAMMLLYTFNTSAYDTLMIHASVIAYRGAGYVFLGRSGTGKSTHSRLWLENIEGTYLLNDDNPVIRVIDGEVMVYGSPWSGKTPCYRNEVMPLGGVVRLSQAPYNKITRFVPLQAYASLMPACSCMRWDRRSTDALHKTVESVIKVVPGWHLECLPDADAAHTCCSTITNQL